MNPQPSLNLLLSSRVIIPCRSDKKPLLQSWKSYQENRPSDEEIASWKEPAPPVWAMVTGKASDIITLDFDSPQGEQTMQRLGLQPHRKTPSGGYHVDFWHPGWHVPTLNGKSKIELGKRYPGLDIRGDGGYACIVGMTDKGRYEWLRWERPDPLDILPEAVREFLGLLHPPASPNGAKPPVPVNSNGTRPAQKHTTNGARLVDRALAQTDGRNNSGFWLACQLRDAGYAEQDAARYMSDYASRTGNVNTKGQAEPYTDSDAMASLRQAYSRPAREAPAGSMTGAGRTAQPGIDLSKFPFTDLGNSERLVRLYGDFFRWCESWNSFLVWDDTRWKRDDLQVRTTFAKQTIRETYAQAATITDDSIRKPLVDHARRSEGRARVEAMIALARPDVAVEPAAFDHDAWLLNVNNGTLDLRTGQLRGHEQKDLITALADVAYDPEARCPRWKKFLAEVFAPHPDLVPFIRRAIGYSLTGDVREECFFLLAGEGRNGKGTLLKTVQALLGDYAGTADFSTFMVRRDVAMRDDIANMRGQRFVVAQESHEGAAMAEGIMKWLTGGDRIRARRLYENSSEFDPTFKLWLASNYKPKVAGTDSAIWSRIKLIPFDVSFEGREDKQLKKELLKELPGILAWAVRGCLSWQKVGLQFPESVLAATREYRVENDHVGRFIAERCKKDPDAEIRAGDLYAEYKIWCETNGEKELSGTAFGTRAGKIPGVVKRPTRRGNVYVGVAFVSRSSRVEESYYSG